MPKISVIVPVYNAENYLTKCVDSILAQTFGDIEVLLIDDCSKDRSWELCLHYEDIDSRVRAIHREINGGIYSARNDGLKIATGEFVTFVDNDDWLDQVMYEKLITAQIDSGADFVSCGFKEIIDGNVVYHIHKVDGIYTKEEIRNEFIFNLLGEQKISCAVWKTLFRKSVIDDNKLRFTKSKVKDDFYFVVEYLLCCNKAEYIAGDYYNYWIRPSSTIHSVGLSNVEDSVNNPAVIYGIISRCDLMDKSYYSALGMEYITSICRLASICSKKDFIMYTNSSIFRKQMFAKNTNGLPIKTKILYYLVKYHLGGLAYCIINR